MKKIVGLVLLAGCLISTTAWGRSFSIDLRAPAAGATSRARMQAKLATSPLGQSDGTLRRVDLDAGIADVGEIEVGDELSFTLFDDVAVTVTLAEKMPTPLGGEAFLAEASGYEGVKNAVVLRTSDGLTVDIQDYFNKKVYKVISTAAGVSVQEVEARGGKCGCDDQAPAAFAEESQSRLHKAKKATLLSGTGGTCVDILVAFDRNATTWANANGGGVLNFAQMAVQKMNTALANNGIDGYFRFRLVGAIEVSAASADLDAVLDAATYGTGAWASIKAKRDEVGADIVTVLIDTGSAYGTTGLGRSLKTTNISSFSESGYNVCAIRSVAQSHTMTHEVGHNMGCGHSDIQTTKPGPQLYGYSSGYYFTANGVKYHTIMAYDGEGPGGAEVPFFSSPYCSYEGVAVGDSSHNNGSTLCNTYSGVSAWRADKGIDLGGDDTLGALEWLRSRDAAFSKARSEGKKIFLLAGRDTCMNTMGTRNNSCEDPSVKRHLLKNYVCWYNLYDSEFEDAGEYFQGYNIGSTFPFIAIIDPSTGKSLTAEGGYHTVNELLVMLGRVAKEVRFSPASGTIFSGSVNVSLSASSGAAIYYTLNGTLPSAGPSFCYDGPITLTAGTTIWAATFANGAWGVPVDAIFIPSRVSLFFNANGGTGGKTLTANGGAPLGDSMKNVSPKRDGYLFNGWWTAKTGGEMVDASTMAIADATYYAHWTPLTFTRGGNVAWSQQSDGSWKSGAITDNQQSWIKTTVSGTGTLTFKWKTSCEEWYDRLTFLVDGEEKGFIYGTESTAWDDTGIIIEDGGSHTFQWTFSKDESDKAGSDCAWIAGIEWKGSDCAITFHANGGTGGKSFASVGRGRTLGYYMKQLSPKRDGYTFDGWWTAKTGGTKVTADDVADGDATYYAHWKMVTYSVQFHANGGTGGKTFSITKGEKLTAYMKKMSPQRAGYSFTGWWTARTGGTWVSPSTAVSGNITYYAQWIAISFVGGDDLPWKQQYDGIWKSGAISHDQFTSFSGTVSGPGVITFKWKVSSEEDYDMLCFMLDGNYVFTVSGTDMSSWATVAKAVEGAGKHTIKWLYYKDVSNSAGSDCGWVRDIAWIPAGGTCSISFNANGGTGGKTFSSVGTGRTFGYYMNQLSPKRDGYVFNGWWTAKSGGTKVTADDVAIGDATYYAHWKVPTYSITFHANGGTGGKTFAEVAKGATLGTYIDMLSPKRSGYTFDGWWTAKTGGTKVTASTVVNAGATYYAHWK